MPSENCHHLSVDEEVAYSCSISFPATTVPACQGVIVGLADTVDRHYHPKPSLASQSTGGVLGSTGLLLLLPLVGGRGASSLGNLLCAVFRTWSSPYPWWCQQLVRPTAARPCSSQTHQHDDNHHRLQTSRLALHNDGKFFFSSKLGGLDNTTSHTRAS